MLARTAEHPKAIHIVFAIMAEPAFCSFAVILSTEPPRSAYLTVLIVTGGAPAMPAPNCVTPIEVFWPWVRFSPR